MTKRHPEQLTLDFSSQLAERLALLRSLERPLEGNTDWTPERIAGVVELLQRIAILSTDGTTSRARVATLGARVHDRRSVSAKTINRWTRDAVSLGLLTVDVESRRRGGCRTNAWQLNWSQIKAVVRHQSAISNLKSQIVTPPVEVRHGCVTVTHPGCVTVTHLTVNRNSQLEPPPPCPPDPKPAGGGGTLCEEEAELLRRLTAVGYANARSDLPQWLAQQAAGEIAHILDEYEANRAVLTGPGAIAFRIKRGQWPDPRVVPLAVVQSRQTARAAQQHTTDAERLALRHGRRRLVLIRTARQRGDDEAKILATLRQELPAEFCYVQVDRAQEKENDA